MRLRRKVEFQDLWAESTPDKAVPGAWFVSLTDGLRRLLRLEGVKYNKRVHELRNADPEIDAAMWAHYKQEAELAKELRELEKAKASQEVEAESGGAQEDEASPENEGLDARIKDVAGMMEALGDNSLLNAILALKGGLDAEYARWTSIRLAICVRSICGDWGLLDPDFEGEDLKEIWPRLDHMHPGPGLERRIQTIEMLPEGEKRRLLREYNAFVESGGAGLTEEQKGN